MRLSPSQRTQGQPLVPAALESSPDLPPLSINIDSQGYLCISCHRQAIEQWLEQYLHLPPLLPTPSPANPVTTPEMGPVPIADRLRLSPLAFLQYSHARCTTLMTQLHPSPKTPPDHPSPTLDSLLWHLIALQDALVDTPQFSPRLGCHLCAALYAWEQSLSSPRQSARLNLMALMAVQQTLAVLLRHHLQQPAPGSL